FRKKALLTNLLYFGSFGVLMVAIFRVSFSASGGSQALVGIEGMFGPWALPLRLTRDAICGSPLAIPALFLLCVLPFLLVVWLFSTRYKRILTGLKSQSARSDYKLGSLSATGRRNALLGKEASRFFGTPIYFFNAGFGLLMLPVLAVLAAVFRGKIRDLLGQLTPQMGALPLALILLATVGFFVSTVAITASSISLEGRQLWILKEAPVSTAEIFAAKVNFQMLLCLPIVALSLLLLWFAFPLSPAEGVLLLLAALIYSVAVAYLGLLLNLRFPKLDAVNDTMVVKNSISAVVALFSNILLLAAACGGCALVQGAVGSAGGLLTACLIFAGAVAGCRVLLRTKGEKLFAAL
ncbi:MAG: hypothetical protein RRY53_04690, partial [Pseudoflavonifractor sp.]